MKAQDFLTTVMVKIMFPVDAQFFFKSLYIQIIKNEEYCEKFSLITNLFMANQSKIAYEKADLLAKDMGVSTYAMSMMLLLMCCEPLLNEYYAKNISEDIFWNTVSDLTYKLNECQQVYHVWGTFVRDWFPPFFQMNRFGLGRMQYELSTFLLDDLSIEELIIKKGDRVLNMHIPSSGSFTKEKREDSYHRAYEFYEKDFPSGKIPIVCDSWLLYPKYEEIFLPHSNIGQFRKEFSYIKDYKQDKFEDAWRIFGRKIENISIDLPRETTLQKKFVDYIEKKGDFGVGYGVFLCED